MKDLNLLFGLLLGMIVLMGTSCETKAPKNSRGAQAERGRVFFASHCGSCHGVNADETKIASMTKRPPDLTKIMDRRKGLSDFPVVEIASYIDGRKDVQLHNRDMPAWGKYFADEEKLTNDEIKGKMGELIAYLMSIQK